MIDNGKVEIIESGSLDNDYIDYEFLYDHKKAIEGAKDNEFYCTVMDPNINTYLRSILDIFESNGFRFTDGNIHSNEDKRILAETNGILLDYIYKEVNIYVKKLYIKDGDYVTVRKENDNIISVKIKN